MDAAKVTAAQAWRERWALIIAQCGESDTTCIWRGCSERALANSYLCATHIVGEPDVDFHYRQREQDALKDIVRELTRELGFETVLEPPCSRAKPCIDPRDDATGDVFPDSIPTWLRPG
jgi:hypothetical protein